MQHENIQRDEVERHLKQPYTSSNQTHYKKHL